MRNLGLNNLAKAIISKWLDYSMEPGTGLQGHCY